MQKEISPKIVALTFGVLVISFLAAFYVVAWQEPTQAPPGGNVPAPLNVGPTGQSKAGGLILNTGGAEYGLIVDRGNTKVGRDLKIEIIPSDTTGSYSLDWDGLQICQFGTCCPPWQDCDGDGKTYKDRNDCDEGCSTCYSNSLEYTTSPDGKDQDCDGLVDEPSLIERMTSCSTINVLLTALEQACKNWCSSRGWNYYTYSCDNISSAYGGTHEQWVYASYNFNNCTRSGGVSRPGEKICGVDEYTGIDPPIPPRPGTAQCWCKAPGYK